MSVALYYTHVGMEADFINRQYRWAEGLCNRTTHADSKLFRTISGTPFISVPEEYALCQKACLRLCKGAAKDGKPQPSDVSYICLNRQSRRAGRPVLTGYRELWLDRPLLRLRQCQAAHSLLLDFLDIIGYSFRCSSLFSTYSIRLAGCILPCQHEPSSFGRFRLPVAAAHREGTGDTQRNFLFATHPSIPLPGWARSC